MSMIEILAQYAALLRRAWLNPSYEPWQMDVHRFEDLHDKELGPYFKKWQEISRTEQLTKKDH